MTGAWHRQADCASLCFHAIFKRYSRYIRNDDKAFPYNHISAFVRIGGKGADFTLQGRVTDEQMNPVEPCHGVRCAAGKDDHDQS